MVCQIRAVLQWLVQKQERERERETLLSEDSEQVLSGSWNDA